MGGFGWLMMTSLCSEERAKLGNIVIDTVADNAASDVGMELVAVSPAAETANTLLIDTVADNAASDVGMEPVAVSPAAETAPAAEGFEKLQKVVERIPSATMAMALGCVGYGMLWHNFEMKLLDEKSHEKHLNPIVANTTVYRHDPFYANPFCTLGAINVDVACKWSAPIVDVFMVISLIYFAFYL